MQGKNYTIRRARGLVALTGDVGAGDWARADVAQLNVFPWFEAGQREGTDVRVLYDDVALYIQFIAEDRFISSSVVDLNGPVCTDDCVEFFVCPRPESGVGYLNLEMNCCGVLHLGFGDGRASRRHVAAELAREVRVVTSVAGQTKEEEPDDQGWWLAAALPFDVMAQFSGLRVSASPGDRWRGNFYRCGGRTNPQYACWSEVGTDRPDYHRPECFGLLSFE